MKNPKTLLVLFVLSALTFSNLPSSSGEEQDVFDVEGNPILNGGTYYMLAAIGNGGGIELGETDNETCLLSVVQSTNSVANGMPLVISSEVRILYITEGLALNISFTAVPPCAPVPSEWTIVEDLSHGLAVKITGYETTVPGWFTTHRASIDSFHYKFVFCSSVDSTCGDIGISVDSDGNRRLVVADKDPLLVQFHKVQS